MIQTPFGEAMDLDDGTLSVIANPEEMAALHPLLVREQIDYEGPSQLHHIRTGILLNQWEFILSGVDEAKLARLAANSQTTASPASST